MADPHPHAGKVTFPPATGTGSFPFLSFLLGGDGARLSSENPEEKAI